MPGLTFPRFTLNNSPTGSAVSLPFTENHSAGQSLKRRFPSPRSSTEGARPKTENVKNPKSNLKTAPANPADITMTIESPPLVCYGPPKESTGALLSGLIHLNVQKPEQVFESFTLSLLVEVVSRRPVMQHCSDCSTTVTKLQEWNLITESIALNKGTHTYPFSYLVPGHLPATNINALSKINYTLVALAMSTKGEEIHFRKPITVERSILPGFDRHSIRIFPPTSLSASIKLPPVVHPGGDFPLELRLDGVVSKERSTRWRLRKVSWRIDEIAKVVSPACSHHSNKLGGDGKGILHEDVRTIGSGEIKAGWKSDFLAPGGKVEMELLAGIPAHADAACDVESPCGISVSHTLILEMIVAEEHCPSNQTRFVTPTGAARVLRMQFHLIVTSRSGMGISWDEEAPPVYENVPPSPPIYSTTITTIPEASECPPLYGGCP
ncbi:Endocytosis regulator [Rhizina undulata]